MTPLFHRLRPVAVGIRTMFLPHAIRRTRAWLGVLYLVSILGVTYQRGVYSHTHTTFPIFRQSYKHLVAGRDLYAAYPDEQGSRAFDRFKYSPTAALLFAPVAYPPLALGLLLWNLVNVGALLFALAQLLPRRTATVAAVVVFPALFNSIQASSSNALLAGMMIFAFIATERGQQVRSALLVMVGTLIKIFPISVAIFALFKPHRVRFAGILILVAVLLIALPLLVTSPQALLGQYQSWHRTIVLDGADLSFGHSLMRVVRGASRSAMPNWPLQLAGTALLLLPVVVRRDSWELPEFRLRLLSSLLVFCVIFNHQAENPSYVIAAAGLAIWFATSEVTAWKVAITLLCVSGLNTVPFTVLWLVMQTEMLRSPGPNALSVKWDALARWLRSAGREAA